jgi:hopanoid-associated phosphorylase
MEATGVLCGFRGEARLARLFAGERVACSAARVDLARARGQALLAAGATRLLSFGVAGGVDPALATGDVVVAAHVQTEGKSWTPDPVWTAELRRALPLARIGTAWGADSVMAGRAAKEACFAKNLAQIVDMESHVVAELATAAGVPFAVLRVVVDPQTYTMPPLALDALDENGNTDLPRLLAGLLRAPSQLPSLIRLGRLSGTAMAALKRTARAIERS